MIIEFGTRLGEIVSREPLATAAIIMFGLWQLIQAFGEKTKD